MLFQRAAGGLAAPQCPRFPAARRHTWLPGSGVNASQGQEPRNLPDLHGEFHRHAGVGAFLLMES